MPKRKRLQIEDYTVGWVCALLVALAAAAEMLDEEHEDIPRNIKHGNLYTLVRIGEHKTSTASYNPSHSDTITHGHAMSDISGVSTGPTGSPILRRTTNDSRTVFPEDVPQVSSREASLLSANSVQLSPSIRPVPTVVTQDEEEFDPISPPPGYNPLNFKPHPLERWFLCLSIIFLLGCCGTMLAFNLLWRADPSRFHIRKSISSYRAYRYVPGLLGVFTTLLWRSIARTYNRIAPYMFMAAVSKDEKSHKAQAFLSGFEPRPGDLKSLFHERHYLTILINLMTVVVLPLLTPLKNTYIAISADSKGWIISISPAVGYSLIAVYVLLVLATTGIMVKTWSVTTGLKWDPASFASQIALVNESNIYDAFYGLEYVRSQDLKKILQSWSKEHGILRLGYWQSRQPIRPGNRGRIVHGIRFLKGVQGVERKPPHEQTNCRANSPILNTTVQDLASVPKCPPQVYGIEEMPLNDKNEVIYAPERRRYSDFVLQHTDIILLIYAFICISCVSVGVILWKQGKLEHGFRFVPVHDLGIFHASPETLAALQLASRRFLYIFLPSFLVGIFNFIFLPAEKVFKAMQPLANMDKGGPTASANETLLLDYITDFPPIVVIKALKRYHFRVAWFTLLSLLSSSAPIVPGGIFNFRQEGDTQNIQSPTDQEQHLKAQVRLAKRRYEFGMYRGVEGRRHIGFEVATKLAEGHYSRPVDKFRPGWAVSFGPFTWWIKAPGIVRTAQPSDPESTSTHTSDVQDELGNGELGSTRHDLEEKMVGLSEPAKPAICQRWPQKARDRDRCSSSHHLRPDVAHDPAMADGTPDFDAREE
ncbi:MAG: hypothetical protein Q9160_002962 [Pyrenula sp. 1 TL-2023]